MLGRFTTYPPILFATFLGTREHTVDPVRRRLPLLLECLLMLVRCCRSG